MYRKKLIEVALPLKAINAESAREKSIRHGHPSTLHLWWARRPLATCRAVLFASIVDDPDQPDVPSALLDRIDVLPPPDPLLPEWDGLPLGEQRRHRLFAFIGKLVKWENSNDEYVVTTARGLIDAATDGKPPPVLDPFCGGGSIPLEAQRLGLEAHASDLNPVAVLITKALIEIPPKFAGQPPVNPQDRGRGAGAAWKGSAGLAADVRYYGRWMRDEAERRIGHLYPKAKLPDGREANVVAWLWARTVPCPNPACEALMPLVRSFALSTKSGRQAWAEPKVDRSTSPAIVRFDVKSGKGAAPEAPKLGRGARFRCLACGQVADDQHIKSEAKADRMGAQLMALVAEGQGERVYLNATREQEFYARVAPPDWVPGSPLANDPRNIWCVNYGLDTFSDLFTPRQLVALVTFSDLIGEVRQQVEQDASLARLPDEARAADDGRTARAYGDALATYMAFGLSKLLDRSCSLVTWFAERDSLYHAFARQVIPMSWDFAESNTVLEGAGSFVNTTNWISEVFGFLADGIPGSTGQMDAAGAGFSRGMLVATDPPYYDNIAYADLSDFFYVWLRRSLGGIHPDLFSTLLVPKAQELVATPYRFDGSKAKAQTFFEEGLGRAFGNMLHAQHPAYPMTVFYAFKQAESGSGAAGTRLATASTGWETMLEGLLSAGFQITGTWPMRSELTNRTMARATNALASSIVLVCRPRPEETRPVGRAEFLHELEGELPDALHALVSGGVAPVDLQQAAIGPGMAVYSRYPEVQKADGSRLTVREALKIINDQIDGYFRERESDYDAETRWALVWLEQYGFREGLFGEAQDLARAKGTAPNALERAALVESGGGRVKLWRPERLLERWQDNAEPFLQHPTLFGAAGLLAALLDKEGRGAAADAVLQLNPRAGEMPALLAELFLTAEKAGERAAAGLYNQLAIEWAGLVDESVKRGRQGQERLL